jgi:two-component system OmpR family response regulator
MARLESIHRDNFSEKFYYKDYFMINNKDKEVLDRSNNELNIRGKACDILSYLVQNEYGPPISREELLQSIWDEPELICPNIIDINISKIRVNLKKKFGINMIKTVRHKGFKLVDI